MKRILLLAFLFSAFFIQAQDKIYRAEREKVNNLVHTKLKVDFNYENSTMNGEAWVTLTPHFYPVNKVVLDAKSFKIKEVKLNNSNTPFNYTDDQITIELDKTYKKGEEYTVFIKYIAQPEEVIQQGSQFIKDAKGLYFIDPKDEDPEKPTQIWTQGETESSSCWFPTIDSPNQKTSQEIYMTVPDKYVTLSNGLLEKQTNNGNGTRTDYWKMDEKHAPYLFFMGVGDFSIVKDTWEGLAVDYYVEKEFEDVADDIFGLTPEMMTFFSELTGVNYPWDKYAQIVVRDYVSGAMENTTAVVHGEDAQQPKGKLIDKNDWEGTIAHELFHHWFGDLVTTESWANLTVNESFATYSVYLWYEYKYGKDKAHAHMFDDIEVYKQSKNEDKDLVRFYYKDKEHMFDPVSYHKGSAILHMLRDYLGDEAFFTGMNKYLNDYKFGTAEAHELRLAFEKVSGKDLNWFFNQWYYGNSHIKMNVSYDYNTINKTVTVNIKQYGQTFEFPVSIDIYEENKVLRHNVWVKDNDNSFSFQFNKLPQLVNVDAKNILLADINDRKSVMNYVFQYANAPHYQDRREAIVELAKNQHSRKEAYNTILKALNDPYYELRVLALQSIDLFQKHTKKDAIYKIEQIAKNDENTLVKAEAIKVLGKLIDPIYQPIFKKELENESFAVLGSAIFSMYQIDKEGALAKIKTLDDKTQYYLADIITSVYINEKDKTKLPFIANHVLTGMFLSENKTTQQTYTEAFKWIAESDNSKAIENLVNDFVEKGIDYKQYNFDKMAVNMLNQIIYMQQQSSNINKGEIVLMIKKGLAKLIE
jgi:aminopeptidase N